MSTFSPGFFLSATNYHLEQCLHQHDPCLEAMITTVNCNNGNSSSPSTECCSTWQTVRSSCTNGYIFNAIDLAVGNTDMLFGWNGVQKLLSYVTQCPRECFHKAV
jgi:hypothetical protein